MSTTDPSIVDALREVLRTRATHLALDPASITSPTSGAITGRAADGSLVRLDVSTYQPTELSR
jgi:hypothetical protein